MPMLFSLIASVVWAEASDTVDRGKRTAMTYLIGAILAITGIGFLIGAAYIATARRYGDFDASIAFGAGFLILAVLIVVVQRIASGVAARRAADRRRREMREIATAASAGILGSRKGVYSGLAGAMLTGLALGFFRDKNRHD